MACGSPVPALVILFNAAAVAGGAAGCAAGSTFGGLDAEAVSIHGERFNLLVAADDPTRIRGLQDRLEILPDGGMIFVYPDAAPRWFWMPNCLVDIDVIFLDAETRVTATHTMKAEPPRGAGESVLAYRARLPYYSSVSPAQYAIELKAGMIERLGVTVGDTIELETARLKAFLRWADESR